MNYLFLKLTLRSAGIKKPLILWGVLLSLFIIGAEANAQTVPVSITISGACLNSTYVLDKVFDNYEGTNRPAYRGSGTVTVGTSTSATTITIFYQSTGPAWVMAFDGQPYQSNSSTSSIPPTTGWTVVTGNSSGNCNGTLIVATEAPAGTLALSPTSSGPVCAGTPVNLMATPTNIPSPITYSWSSSPAGISGSGSSSTITLSTPAVTTGTTFIVTVTATSGATSATASASVTVNPVPGLVVGTGSNPTTCGGTNGSIAFTTTNLPNGTYSLSYSGAGSPKTVTVSGNAFTLTGLPAGVYSSFSIINGGCTGSAATSRTLTDPTAPALALNTATSICVGQPVTLTATSGFSTYTFTSGSGSVGSGASNMATVSGLSAGLYSFSVTATAPNSCTNTASTSTTVNPLPVPTLSASGTITCAQPTQTLTAGGGTDYAFSGPGGSLPGSGNTRTVNAGGLYSVTVTASGCSSTTSVQVYEDKTAPTPTLTASSTAVCSPASITLTAGGGVSYTFSAGASQIGTTNQAVVTQSGTYSVTVAGTNGCTSTTSITVAVNPLPVPTLSVSGTITCAQPTQTLTAGGGTSYAFARPGLAAQNTSAGSATVNAGGLYSVTVTASGCSSTTSVQVYEDKTAPTPTLTASSTAVCSPASITLTAGGGVSYTFSAGASQVGSSNQAVVNQSGTYTVTVAGTNGCTSTTSITVAVNPLPAAPTLTGVSRSITQSNTPLSLLPFVAATGSNALSFSGTTGLINPPTVSISQVGVQNFLVTQTDGNGCTSTATPFSLTIEPSIPANQTVCRSTPTVLTSITVGAQYEWYKNGTSAPFKLTEIASIQKGTRTASLTVVSPQTTANYYLKVVASNGSFIFEGPFKVTIDFSCTGSPRLAASEPIDVPLSVMLTSNPITGGKVRAIIQGASGKALTVTLFDLQGRPAGEQHWKQASSEQAVELPISMQPSGVYLLQAQTPEQRKTIRVINP